MKSDELFLKFPREPIGHSGFGYFHDDAACLGSEYVKIDQTNSEYYIEICQQLSYRHDILGMIINEISCIDRSCLLYASVE